MAQGEQVRLDSSRFVYDTSFGYSSIDPGMYRVQFRFIKPPMYSEIEECIAPSVADIMVPLPWANHSHPEELPEIEGRQQFSIREMTGVEIERPEWEYTGWTVEFSALVKCPWADFWITATALQQPAHLEPPGWIPKLSEPERKPAVNLSIAEALRLAKQLRDGKREAEKRHAEVGVGVVRLRHQGTGNIIYADVL